jgi:predicted Zn finger-like uncharacterized protein
MLEIVCPSCAAAYEIDETTVTETGRKVRCAGCSTIWRVYPKQNKIEEVSTTYTVEPGANPYATEPAEDIFGEGGPMLRHALEEQASHVDEPKSQSDVQVENVSANAIEAMAEALASQELVGDNSDLSPMAAVVAHEEPVQTPRAKLTRDKSHSSTKKKQKSSFLSGFFSWKTASIATALLTIGAGFQWRETVVQHLPQTANIYAAVGLPVNLRGVEIRNVASRILDDNGVNILVIDGDLHNVTKRKIDLPRLRFAVRGADGQEVYVWSAQADKNALNPGESLNFRRRLAAPPNDGKDISVRFLTRADTTAGIK